ncbi:InlB B-repeat-containing protein [uncultured Fibrobacter sp.]|uniref:InlB B-repeat-containing protein n=1 Tax=uncultured Fibrobacter sp. TaxID=261512 RepID=UPI0025DA29D2|nr:InlB B-repeat-containing protein [uncultured Fibrobacter sp.]
MSVKLTYSVIFFAFAVLCHAATTITPVQPTLKNGCYQISNAAELYGFAAIVNGADDFPYDATACGKLTKDIVVNQNVLNSDGTLNVADTANFAKWTPIGPFYGSFDGQNHTVSGLYYSDGTITGAGLFKSINSSENQFTKTVVKNVGVVGSFFRAGYSAGGITGSAYARQAPVVIENCYNASRVEVSNNNAGGIVGTVTNYTTVRIELYNVYNTGTISGPNRIGGLVGYEAANGIAVINAYNAGEIVEVGNTNYIKSVFGNYTKDNKNVIENVFYLKPGRNEFVGTPVTEDELKSGAITQVMRHYDLDGVDGSAWGQKVGTDPLPIFSGSLTGASLQTIKMNLYHGSTKLKTKDMVIGYSYRIPNVAVDGYDFFGWHANSSLTGDTVVHTPATLTADVSYWGRYEKRFNVTYNLNGGTIDSGRVETYTETVGAILPKKVSRNGYVFAGWYDNSGLTGNRVKVIGKTENGDKAFYAKWYQIKKPAKDTDGCYLISTAPELYGFASIVNGTDGYTRERDACAKLSADITVNNNVLNSDGTLKDSEAALNYIPWNPIDSFAGVFNGNGHVVSGLFYDDSTYYERFGFFAGIGGTSDKYAVLKDFGLVDSYFAVKSGYFGTVVGQVIGAPLGGNNNDPGFYAKISGVYTESTLSPYADAQGAAGLVGSVGFKSLLDIENCYNYGLVLKNSYKIAGVLAHAASNTTFTISNCYSVWKSKSLMSRSSKAFIFVNVGPSMVKISNCYYLDTQAYSEQGGLSATAEQFKNGSVAAALRDGKNGSVWGQNVGTDAYPNLSGKLQNSLAQRYTITFHTFAGDTANYFDGYVAGFKKMLPTTVEKENTAFMGWFDNAKFAGDVVSQIEATDSGDKEFWAKLQRKFSVSFDMDGGTITSGAIDSYIEGVGAKLPQAVLRDSNVFAGWYDNDKLTGLPVTEITPADSGNKVYYAAWLKLKMPALDSADGCYVITDVAELFGYAAYVSGKHRIYYNSAQANACGKLANDIVVNQNVLKADGSLDSANVSTFLPWESIRYFGATFDGQGHKISGLYMSEPDSGYVGFIAEITTVYDASWNIVPAVIKNLTIEDTYVAGRNYVGGFVAYTNNRALTIENCHFNGMVVGLQSKKNSATYVGGLIGESLDKATTTITDSDVGGYVESRNNAGGLAGVLNGTVSVTNCRNSAKVVGGKASTGGLAGSVSGTAVFMNTSNHGDVSNLNLDDYSGSCAGLVGSVNNRFTLLQSYNEGSVDCPSTYVGGLVAEVNSGWDNTYVIANNYNIGRVHSERDGRDTYVSGLVASLRYSNIDIKLVNNHSIAELSKVSPSGAVDYILANPNNNSNIIAENNFVLGTVDSLATTPFGTVVEADKFKDGTVADSLHDYVEKDDSGNEIENGITGIVWAQGDEYPVLVTKDHFSVVLNLNGGTLKNAPTTYKYGDGLTLPKPTRTGYNFAGWFKSANFQGNAVTEITKKDAGDKIFYAKWEAKQFTITVKVNNPKWGVVEGLNKSGIYSYDSEVTLMAVPDNGYEFSNWQDDVHLTSASLRVLVTKDTTILANFKAISSSSVASSSSVNPPNSSSSAKSSSSSAKSSSSVTSSSSSAKSSSSVKPTSSSAKAKSSSSSAKSSSSSKKGKSSNSKDALQNIAVAPLFDVEVVSRDIHIAGANVGKPYALFDVRGKVMLSGVVDASNFALTVPHAGKYIVRMGPQSRVVTVR